MAVHMMQALGEDAWHELGCMALRIEACITTLLYAEDEWCEHIMPCMQHIRNMGPPVCGAGLPHNTSTSSLNPAP